MWTLFKNSCLEAGIGQKRDSEKLQAMDPSEGMLREKLGSWEQRSDSCESQGIIYL